jgi:hypothetical protein
MNMAERWLRSSSGTRDEGSFDNTKNIYVDSNSTYLESEADITVRANPRVEVRVQNSEVTAHDGSNATLANSTSSPLQDLLTAIMAALQAEICKQTPAFQKEVAKVTETLKAQFSQENEKLAASLTLNLLTTTIVAPPSNTSKWQMGFINNYDLKLNTKFI